MLYDVIVMKFLTLPLIVFLLALSLYAEDKKSPKGIQPGESLSIIIKGVPLSQQRLTTGSYTVNSQGLIFLPYIEKGLLVSGLPTDQIARKIEKLYIKAKLYPSPRLTVIFTKELGYILTQSAGPKISIGGHVKRTGQIPFKKEMTLQQAVDDAGGATAFGIITRVELFRFGKKTVHDLRKPKDQKLKLQAKDIINIPQKRPVGAN